MLLLSLPIKNKQKISSSHTKTMQSLEALLESKGNYKRYRTTVRAHRDANKFALPYLGVYLRDLVFCDEGMDSRIEGMLNVEKVQVKFVRVFFCAYVRFGVNAYENKFALPYFGCGVRVCAFVFVRLCACVCDNVHACVCVHFSIQVRLCAHRSN